MSTPMVIDPLTTIQAKMTSEVPVEAGAVEGRRRRKRRLPEGGGSGEEIQAGSSRGRKHTKVSSEEADLPNVYGAAITAGNLQAYRKQMEENPPNRVLSNILRRGGLRWLIAHRMLVPDRIAFEPMKHKFNVKVKYMPQAPDQGASGRCWMFAGLNTIVQSMRQKYKLPKSFELSQSFLFFHDKMERSNRFLEDVIMHREEPLESLWNDHSFSSPVSDGGYWQFFFNLVEKYGVVPKDKMRESADTRSSRVLKQELNERLRTFGMRLRERASQGATIEELRKLKHEQLVEVRRMVSILFGEPPETFDWGFKIRNERNRKTRTARGVSPKEFYERYVPYSLAGKVSLMNYPHRSIPFETLYTRETSRNMIGGKLQHYLNLRMEDIKKVVIRSLRNGDPVYFTCDVGKKFDWDQKTLDERNWDFNLLFGHNDTMTKIERVESSASYATHAMTLTGVQIENGKPVRWRVLNSWGMADNDREKNGELTMSDKWLDRYCFNFTVARKHADNKIKRLLEQDPLVIPISGLISRAQVEGGENCFCHNRPDMPAQVEEVSDDE